MSFDNVLGVNSNVVGLLSVVTISLSSRFRDFSRYGHNLSSKLVLGTCCKMLLLLTQRSLFLKGLFIPLAIVIKEWSNLYLITYEDFE